MPYLLIQTSGRPKLFGVLNIKTGEYHSFNTTYEKAAAQIRILETLHNKK